MSQLSSASTALSAAAAAGRLVAEGAVQDPNSADNKVRIVSLSACRAWYQGASSTVHSLLVPSLAAKFDAVAQNVLKETNRTSPPLPASVGHSMASDCAYWLEATARQLTEAQLVTPDPAPSK